MQLGWRGRASGERLWLILLLVTVGCGSAAFATLRQPATYQSTATLLLNPNEPDAPGDYTLVQAGTSLGDTYAEMMRTQSFADRVARALPFRLPAAEVASAIRTELVPNTLFFKITAGFRSPGQAQQFVATVVTVFLADLTAQQRAQAGTDAGRIQTTLRDRLNAQVKTLDAQIRSDRDRIAGLSQGLPASETRSQLLELRGQLVSLQQTQAAAIDMLQALDAATVPVSPAWLVDPARPGRAGPNLLVGNVLAAGAVGLAVGLGLAFLLNSLDSSVRTAAGLERLLGLAPLALIGLIEQPGGRGRSGRHASRARPAPVASPGAIVIRAVPGSRTAESFRSLRTNLQFSSLDWPLRSLLVTSAMPGEGKSFTAANLAIAAAEGGQRVVLVDVDLRRPVVHQLFEVPNHHGFSSMVLGDHAAPGQGLQPLPDLPNFTLVTSGPPPPNPSELLQSPQAAALRARLAIGVDLVIYDTPPMTVATDAAVLAGQVDGVLLVVDAGQTPAPLALRALSVLRQAGAPAVLPVLNRVRAADLPGDYDYYSGSTHRARRGRLRRGRARVPSPVD